ncbi:MAG: DNA repair exonuclease [Candidatus Spechtbacterales bacterium]
MKFLHTSDIHIGAKFEMLGEKAPKQREQIKRTFSNVVDLAIKEKVDLVLLAGDLFDSNHPSQKNIEFVKNEFSRLNEEDIKVCLIPGNHDFKLSDASGLGGEFFDIPGVYLFVDPEGGKGYFDDINTEVFAKANISNKSSESPIINADSDRDSFKIVMAHGGVVGQAKDPEYPIQPSEIENCGAYYVALGDWHSLRNESRGDVKAFYSGSPEMISISQSGSGYVLMGEVTGDRSVDVRKVKVGERETETLNIDAGELSSVDELKEKIKEHASGNRVLIVGIGGINSNKLIFSTDELEEELQDDFWRLRIRDKSTPPLEDLNEDDYPAMLISGQFLQLMKDKIGNAENEEERKLHEEALQLGLLSFQDPDVIQ